MNLKFDNRVIRELVGETEVSPTPRQVHGAHWSPAPATRPPAPKLLAWSQEMAESLGLSEQQVQSERFLRAFSGTELLPGMESYAMCYGGHQFGNWAGQLGDGRAINLGEVIAPDGQRWELQLKGAGLTPYSRHADGKAVLRSSIREFLCSEAVHHLGIPTTRALSLISTGEPILRDMFYDGRPEMEPGAVVCRVSPSFLRFGNYEIFASREETQLLERLVDFTISRDFPELDPAAPQSRQEWFRQVCIRTAELMAHWMRVGFVHGVMNTDNMSVLGLTIDYGPYGWLDPYDPHWTPNTTDFGHRRYRYGQQPAMAQWNLQRLATALAPLFGEVEPLVDGLQEYAHTYNRLSAELTAAKFGLLEPLSADDEKDDVVDEAFGLMELCEVDFTLFFRRLAALDLQEPSLETLAEAFYDEAKVEEERSRWESWLERYAARVGKEWHDRTAEERKSLMNRTNPAFILRNYLAVQAIEAAEQRGDLSLVHDLLERSRRPYDELPDDRRWTGRRPDWARDKPGCSTLSCSS